jgi:hypothetical protein
MVGSRELSWAGAIEGATTGSGVGASSGSSGSTSVIYGVTGAGLEGAEVVVDVGIGDVEVAGAVVAAMEGVEVEGVECDVSGGVEVTEVVGVVVGVDVEVAEGVTGGLTIVGGGTIGTVGAKAVGVVASRGGAGVATVVGLGFGDVEPVVDVVVGFATVGVDVASGRDEVDASALRADRRGRVISTPSNTARLRRAKISFSREAIRSDAVSGMIEIPCGTVVVVGGGVEAAGVLEFCTMETS